jgi:hypothetical protein
MKIAFTLCSNNYLAQAKTLGDSIKELNPEYQFYIGLVDTFSAEIDYSSEIGFPIILSNEIGIPDFDSLWKKYSIIELNTCVKPFYIQYFIERFTPIDYLFYIDPDILIYDDLKLIENNFEDSSELLLTPHILSPIPLDGKTPGENTFLNYGIFNLGFLGLKRPEKSNQFINWWKERTYILGFDQTSNGLFVDQLWFNLVPVFFENVKISKHPGLNIAPWNLHERKLARNRSVLFTNQSFPLVFYHFSKYDLSDPELICKNYSRPNFESNLELKSYYQEYSKLLLNNGIQKLSKIRCSYVELRESHLEAEYKIELSSANVPLIKRLFKSIIPPTGLRIFRSIKYMFFPRV